MHFCYFLREIFKIFSNLSQTIVFFVQMIEKLTQGSFTLLEKYAKIVHLL